MGGVGLGVGEEDKFVFLQTMLADVEPECSVPATACFQL